MKVMLLCGLLLMLMTYGCAPAVVGGAATGTYKATTDERSVGRLIDDSTITAKINMAFLEDPLIQTLEIDVDTVEGDVILTGVVGSNIEVTRAVEIAKGVEGVHKVINNLQVGSKSLGQSFEDKVLGSKIKAKLFVEPHIRSFNIDVDVERSVVTLTGKVDSQTNKNRIIEIARTTEGTVKVIDNLTVTHP